MTSIYLPDMILQYIFDYANSGPFQITYDVKSKKFIQKINPNFLLLKDTNNYKIHHLPEVKVEYDISNFEKTLVLYFTLPLKISEKYRNKEEDIFLKITEMYTIDLNTEKTYHCSIYIPYYYHLMNREYIRIHKILKPTTTHRNYLLWKGLEKINNGKDLSIG
jgi:hypothetical protein